MELGPIRGIRTEEDMEEYSRLLLEQWKLDHPPLKAPGPVVGECRYCGSGLVEMAGTFYTKCPNCGGPFPMKSR